MIWKNRHVYKDILKDIVVKEFISFWSALSGVHVSDTTIEFLLDSQSCGGGKENVTLQIVNIFIFKLCSVILSNHISREPRLSEDSVKIPSQTVPQSS
jgi:hypothetical protein